MRQQTKNNSSLDKPPQIKMQRQFKNNATVDMHSYLSYLEASELIKADTGTVSPTGYHLSNASVKPPQPFLAVSKARADT